MMEEKIRKEIENLADTKYREFHSGLCPGISTIMGVRIPVLRDYAKKLIKELSQEKLEKYLHMQGNFYEETMLQGMLIGLSKVEWEKKKKYLEEFVPKIDNWAICDVVCAGIKEFKKTNLQEDGWNFLARYAHAKEEFSIRFGIVMWLDHYVNENYIEAILGELDDIKCEAYYAQMAVAWLLSVCYIKFPKQTKKYLKESKIDDFTYGKAIQKTIESYRITEEEKAKLRIWKRDRREIEI